MYSLYKGGPGVLHRKFLENIECRKSHLPYFLGLFFIFLFFINHFFYYYYFYYSLISIKNGHYSLISKPHPDPLALLSNTKQLQRFHLPFCTFLLKKVNRKVHGVPQAQVTANTMMAGY